MSLRASDIRVGDTQVAVIFEDIARSQLVMYAGASGDYHPMHTDEIYATQAAGLPTVFAQGMLTMGASARIITDWVGPGRLVRYGVRFVDRVWPGDRVVASATVVAIYEEDGVRLSDFSLLVRNGRDHVVLTGTVTAVLDHST